MTIPTSMAMDLNPCSGFISNALFSFMTASSTANVKTTDGTIGKQFYDLTAITSQAELFIAR
jgi:hypothetical protein